MAANAATPTLGRHRGRSRRKVMSEINVTPMVDVMLVLLIIFMVTAPLIQQGVKVNLPEAKATPVEAADKKLVLYDSGHVPYPTLLWIKEALDWLDRYLGPVAQTAPVSGVPAGGS